MSYAAPTTLHKDDDPRSISVLVVDDEADIRELCAEALRGEGYSVITAAGGADALRSVREQPVDIVLADIRMPGFDGLSLLERLRAEEPSIDVILMTGYSTVSGAVQALRAGAADYLTKPLHLEELIHRIDQLAGRRNLQMVRRVDDAQGVRRGALPPLVGSSRPMHAVYRRLLVAADRRIPVLITGETGTGKELAARAIHQHGPLAKQPFVAVDCASLSAQLIESELFGHVRGAFTDACGHRTGLLAQAGEGTVFLDEIGELPLPMQARLLRVLQEREFRPVGSDRCQPLRARVVAATNRDLEAEVRNGAFREDLFYRLNVFAVEMPPLREHSGDIPELIHWFIAKHGSEETRIAPDAESALASFGWPGNIRQLENTIAGAVASCDGSYVRLSDLPAAVRIRVLAKPPGTEGYLETVEREAILRMLRRASGHTVRAAALLGISRSCLYRKLRTYGIADSECEQAISA